ncbi:helix-turn-helix transcriptional regulator [Brevibacillus nitrificans]|uniref:AraC family transcriptional regulator n=1 Tax=Brevibacillus nitrificans TaxID=651560 RepID=UPI002E1D9B07|nr:helix-turn-helix transcriptional regulator [Brevibacillus nitrificans]
MVHSFKQENNIRPLKYKPVFSYPYDLEIFSVSSLKERTPEDSMKITYRYEFYMLICVTEGMCTQWVDFEPIPCKEGTLIVVTPGQVHNFGHDDNWDGWVILFREEFLLPASLTLSELNLTFDIGRTPNHLTLNNTELQRAITLIEQMVQDSFIQVAKEDVHMLLRFQLYAFVTWLNIIHKQKKIPSKSQVSQKFLKFQELVEKNYAKLNHVSDYAALLNCTEKTLTRITVAAVGISAKAFISARISLEAKRLLMHTDYLISDIAERLNFQETTHFSKFFKRETGYTPVEFRKQNL